MGSIKERRVKLLRIETLIVAAGVLAGGVACASETGPVIVIPGKAGVPVVLNGVDISYAVVEGDWGLDRPSQTNPQVIYRYFPPPVPYTGPRAHYFPGGGPPPRLGRQEVNDARPPSPNNPQPTTYENWNARSDPTPATSPTPLDTPGMVVVPEVGFGGVGPRRR
jgi:hypothetical protein